MKIRYILLVFGLLGILSACDDYLAESPSKSGVIPQKVSDLQKYYYSGIQRNMAYYRSLITDDIDLPFTEYDIESRGGFAKYVSQFYPVLFQRDYLSKSLSGSKALWESAYRGIYNDNYVLSMANSDELDGTEEERERLISFAHFNRARNMFELVTTYCQPWNPGVNDDDLGIVLKDEYSLDFNAENLGRKTLKESYDFIESDIKASLNMPDGNEMWKPTIGAVYAFSARFYLMKADYNEALKYANLALEKNASLEDFTSFTTRNATIRGLEVQVVPEVYDLTTFNDYSILNIKGEYLVETMQVSGELFIPSNELLELYNTSGNGEDVRSWFFPENGLGSRGYLKSQQSINTTGKYPVYMGYSFGVSTTSFANVAEVMLIKAECLIKSGNKNVQEAKSILNTLRTRRIRNYDQVVVNNLTTDTEVLDFIYDERRRERPFLLRGLDIRRFKATGEKDITIKRNFFEITENKVTVLPKQYILTDNDYANKLFEGDITISKGYLEQNP